MSAMREMTLKEWVEQLPVIHRARKEYEALLEACKTALARIESDIEGYTPTIDGDLLRDAIAKAERK